MQSSQAASSVLDLVKGFVQIEQKHFNIQQAWLFGSWAYGNPNVDSDIDLGLVIDSIDWQTEIEVFRAGQNFNSKLEVIVFEKDQFEKGQYSLIVDIKEKGVQIL